MQTPVFNNTNIYFADEQYRVYELQRANKLATNDEDDSLKIC